MMLRRFDLMPPLMRAAFSIATSYKKSTLIYYCRVATAMHATRLLCATLPPRFAVTSFTLFLYTPLRQGVIRQRRFRYAIDAAAMRYMLCYHIRYESIHPLIHLIAFPH